MAIEIKRSTSPKLSPGFRFGREVLKPKEAYLVHGGTGQWSMAKGVTAIDLAGLLERLD